MTAILAIANQKGGVGKTTTAVNLGASLAALEHRVLVVDCDPQGNATRGLGCEPEPPHLYQAIVGSAPPASCLRPTAMRHLTLLPAGRDLVGLEVELVGVDGWEQRLGDALRPVSGDFEIVLLDCPPSLGHLTVSALAAADGVIVPLQCEYYALEGISALVATVDRVRAAINPRLKLVGVALTMYDERTNLSRDVAEEARRHFGDRVFRTLVPRNVRLAEAPSYGQPALLYDIKSRGAEAYLALARELVEAVL